MVRGSTGPCRAQPLRRVAAVERPSASRLAVVGGPESGYTCLIASRELVARITAGPGEGAALRRETLDALAAITAARMAFFLAGRDRQGAAHTWWWRR